MRHLRSRVLPNTSSTKTATSSSAKTGASTHAAVSVVSPGKEDEDEKNQDRLMLREASDSAGAKCLFAIVCDGTSTSPFSAEAAEHVSQQVNRLFDEDGVRHTVEALREMRLALLAEPVKLDEGHSELLRGMFEEIIRQKYQSAYQTTFVAVCLKADENSPLGKISIKALGCGDSALFIFREDGELLFNNVNLRDMSDPFKHDSPLTAVLPDSYDEATNHVLIDCGEYPEGVHLLLCSDGFYDGFLNFKEIRDWLNERLAESADPKARETRMAELHRKLERKKGDDDISFIWLRPVTIPPEEASEEVGEGGDAREEKGEAEDQHPDMSYLRKPGLFARLWAAIFRFFKLSTR